MTSLDFGSSIGILALAARSLLVLSHGTMRTPGDTSELLSSEAGSRSNFIHITCKNPRSEDIKRLH